jgi:hypothetical protein
MGACLSKGHFEWQQRELSKVQVTAQHTARQVPCKQVCIQLEADAEQELASKEGHAKTANHQK